MIVPKTPVCKDCGTPLAYELNRPDLRASEWDKAQLALCYACWKHREKVSK